MLDFTSETILNEFLSSLDEWKYIKIAKEPDEPYSEKDYIYKKHHKFITTHGTLLILELEEISGGSFVISIPDIQKVEINALSNDYQQKIYFDCLIRPNYYNREVTLKQKELGEQVDKNKLFQTVYMRYRIILHNGGYTKR
jgi:hypothetical protein